MTPAFDEWRVTDATLFQGALNDVYRPINVALAAQNAMQALGIRAPSGGAYVVPLFDGDDATLTDEYVLFRPEKEQVGWYDTSFGISGRERFVDCADAAGTEIGHRVQFWLRDDITPSDVSLSDDDRPPGELAPAEPYAVDESAVVDDLRAFVRTEKHAERSGARRAYRELGLDESIRRGETAGPFAFVGTTRDEMGDVAFTLQHVGDDTSLRRDAGLYPGNRCLLDARGGPSWLPLDAEAVSVETPHVTFRPLNPGIDDETLEHGLNETDAWLTTLLNPVPFQRRLDAIDAVAADDAKRELLAGTRPLGFTVNEHADYDPTPSLNDYQRRALVWADAAEDAVCIHGPPGTGKTRTLTAYVRYAATQGQRVLVAAHSNQAVDNLLVGDSTLHSPDPDSLHALSDDAGLSLARAGGNTKNAVVASEYANEPLEGADVVAATTSAAAAFDRNRFDVGVVDEATQASRSATAIVLECARKLVLAGDHKQLPPYSASEHDTDADAHASLFEFLLERYGDDLAVPLREQYRMHADIAAFPNGEFYDGLLETTDREESWTIGDLPPLRGVDVTGPERRDVAGNSYDNPAEADAVVEEVERLRANGLSSEGVGVIAAYTGQVRLLRQRLGDAGFSDVTVDTIDSFQGGEREAVVVSFVRSNDEHASGFLELPSEGPRRLNVALTRARKRLVLVGDWETLGTVATHRTPAESCADVYARLADHLGV
ncbi:AAA domain-containing protein [Salarchaeum sp. JOR-1]|uniref:AAA domain-containing protein n=1 Tax=Salarchaeum sp. JOR-1 TaxID=2599399 RepID=UPI0011982EC8|nr:AAA domain-containing protein [Salarchaeum sp. JOR-1]QDX41262.1 AAA family ATPase [Salarchaeum sp. JOR-1]